ncbi:MAG: helix-turn-helix domain-containing protein, partial [Actinomycetota bacterium]|nr:helix-turn-helix domain-containing protein [Actinomycetota bacterium]
LKLRASAGIGGTVDLPEVPRSRREADQAIRVLRTWRLDQSIARFDEVRMDVLLLHMSDLAGEDRSLMAGPLPVLAEHDRRNGTRYLDTLRAYFDAFGDVRQAARHLRVHVNTVRYRLQKLQDLTGLRLDDADQRLLMMLQLRLLQLRGPESTTGASC